MTRQLALGFAPPHVGGPHSRRGALPMRKAQDKHVPVWHWTHEHGPRKWKLSVQLSAFGVTLDMVE